MSLDLFSTLTTNRLHEEIIAYSTYAQPTPEEAHIREKVFRYIENAVRATIPGSRVGVFGSVVTGLTIPVPYVLEYIPSSLKFNFILGTWISLS